MLTFLLFCIKNYSSVHTVYTVIVCDKKTVGHIP